MTRPQTAGATVVVVERAGRPIGVLAVRDELRGEAADTVIALRKLGVWVAMITGDDPRTAHALAAQAGITTVHADLHPQDKADLIIRLRPPAWAAWRWSATASTTYPPWPPPTSALPWAQWAPTRPSKPPTWR